MTANSGNFWMRVGEPVGEFSDVVVEKYIGDWDRYLERPVELTIGDPPYEGGVTCLSHDEVRDLIVLLQAAIGETP